AAAAASLAELVARDEPAYFTVVRDQLINGLMVERERVVLGAMDDACGRLIRSNPDNMFPNLWGLNWKLQVAMVESLGRYFAHATDDSKSDISSEQWATLEGLTRFDGMDLQFLARRLNTQFERSHVLERARRMSLSPDQQQLQKLSSLDDVVTSARRLGI